MKINTYSPYTDTSYAVGSQSGVRGVNSYSGNAPASANADSGDNGSGIITSQEREFFINMFPQNSEQLENHVVFNRNGKLQSSNVSLGRIVDGRA